MQELLLSLEFQYPLSILVVGVALLALMVTITLWVFLVKKNTANEGLRRDLESLTATLDGAETRAAGAEVEGSRLREKLQVALQDLARAQVTADRAAELGVTVEKQQRQLAENLAEKRALEARFEQQEIRLREQHQLLEQARVSMGEQFENLANRIFTEKQQAFNRSSEANLRKTIDPLERQLQDFRKRVEHVYDRENTERNTLVGQIKALREQTEKISNDALSLATALKGDNKVQGNWGEVVLERILEDSGLQKGREYETQLSVSEGGARKQPDVVVRLPGEKDIVIDAKVSLVDYERYCNAESEEERQIALKQHLTSVRNHIAGLSKKGYEQLEAIRSLDFVFIFVPIEAAYMLALQKDPTLFRDGHEKNVILVSPTTLMASLRMVENIWRNEKQNRNAEKIASEAGKLHDQFVMVLQAFDEIGGRLDAAQAAYDTARKRMETSPGNVLKRVDNLKKLGAKAHRAHKALEQAPVTAEEELTLPEPAE
ncbi:DNA recombination protein RmuC [Biformimicrobium ophioploci]|uniref:DNA recombination protein RmuC n=1 Tax=Biformimicrobium ophioploci TaxID=3036711 RepID=A0ABQ6M1C1_9GAMM|nr:DNA recombination protein RmuC [Microbulbifer sp. NKW57]GMG88151.1 DNA recombination protein RmuC [Microbulbifer sp. NKW57]